ncbi:Spg4p PWA37_003778 [Arxiozyma heterogenica]|uniref:Stationary phase protein 4 n=1 Tax=Arxiozyma heterogenica TaxID=278026 RepID=A0AAN7WLV5_9SACH|nr:hypothetical protein RI543_004930 [Kazachstania heterogenica]
MVKFWDSFQVYNRHKHDDPTLYGGTNTNIGSNNTQYLYAREVYDTGVKTSPSTVDESNVTQIPKRKSSVSSSDSTPTTTTTTLSSPNMTEDNGNKINNTDTMTEKFGSITNKSFSIRNPLEGLDEITKKQISDMSQGEFQSIYNTLKKGGPNNNVNF